MPRESHLKKEMGDRHEEFLVQMLGGRQSRGSGNQWHAPMDGRHNRLQERFAFAWDGKSTTTATISITLPMWEKAREQAGGERPMLGLRWYPTERPTVQNRGGVDLVALLVDDLAEMRESALGLGSLLADLTDLLDQDDAAVLRDGIKRLIQEHSP